jgi:hypothetical protein
MSKSTIFDIQSRVDGLVLQQQLQQQREQQQEHHIDITTGGATHPAPSHAPSHVAAPRSSGKSSHSSSKKTKDKAEFIELPRHLWNMNGVKYGIKYKTKDGITHSYCTIHKIDNNGKGGYEYLCSRHISKDRPREVWKIDTADIEKIYVYKEHNAHITGGAAKLPLAGLPPLPPAFTTSGASVAPAFSASTPGTPHTSHTTHDNSVQSIINEMIETDPTKKDDIQKGANLLFNTNDAMADRIEKLEKRIDVIEENMRDMYKIIKKLAARTEYL